jgi:hypothetical protein
MSDARKRWLVFSNGLERSTFWPFAELTARVDPQWPERWEHIGVAREIRYDSDKMLPDKRDDDIVPYMHDFRRKEPFVRVYQPVGGRADFGEPVATTSIRRRSMAKGRPRFPRNQIAFLAPVEGYSVSPPDESPLCTLANACEAHLTDCYVFASPEGDMLIVLDRSREWSLVSIFVGPTLRVEREGISD